MTERLSECVTTMPLCCGWLRSPPTSSSNKNVLNVLQRARLRAFLFCILVGGDLAQPRGEIHCCYVLKGFSALKGCSHSNISWRNPRELPDSLRPDEMRRSRLQARSL